MKVFCLCIFAALACLIASTEAAISQEEAEIDPDRPNGCLWTNPDTNAKVYRSLDSKWKTGPCEDTSCNLVDGRIVLLRESCGVLAVEPPCRLSEVDESKNYPTCCPREICD